MSDTQLRPRQWVDVAGDLVVEVGIPDWPCPWRLRHGQFRWVRDYAIAQRYRTEAAAQTAADHINRVCYVGEPIATVEPVVVWGVSYWQIKMAGDGCQWYWSTVNPDPAWCVPWVASEGEQG